MVRSSYTLLFADTPTCRRYNSGGAVTDRPPQSRLREVQGRDGRLRQDLPSGWRRRPRSPGLWSRPHRGCTATTPATGLSLAFSRSIETITSAEARFVATPTAHERIVHAQNAAGGDEDVAPQAQQFVGRHRRPIHPGVPQIFLPLALNPQCQRVLLSRLRGLGDVQGEAPHRSQPPDWCRRCARH